MNSKTTSEKLIQFIENSPSAFHTVETIKFLLLKNNFSELCENKHWHITAGGNYFVTRNNSSLIAFSIPENPLAGMRIIASHSDSPTFKIKENPEMECGHHYVKLNVERYGGMIYAPWLDRPLSIAGRVIIKDKETNKLQSKLINIDRDLVLIPNLAIHMNRDANNNYQYNVQKDMLPLFSMSGEEGEFAQMIADEAGVEKEQIIGNDLYLYNRQNGSIWGANQEFLSIGRLDDLQCAFASLKGFLQAETKNSIPVHCVYDNEEVGSETKQGAASTFLYDTLYRINESLEGNDSDYHRLLASSFMVSADNAHAVHPNYADKACPTNRPLLNEGVVIKISANQKYTTDGMAFAVFKQICEKANVPTQVFHNRSDILGGSTLGNISGNQVAVNSVDIGLPQLAMHSPYETAGIKDTGYLVKAAKTFFETSCVETEYGVYELQ